MKTPQERLNYYFGGLYPDQPEAPFKKKSTMSEPKQIAAVYQFPSETNPDRNYETLLYSDRSLSCTCPGWKFKARRLANGERTCKHVRSIQAALCNPTISGVQPIMTYPIYATLITPQLSQQPRPQIHHAHNGEREEFTETKRKRVFNL